MSAQQTTQPLIAGQLPRQDFKTWQEALEAFAQVLSIGPPPAAQVKLSTVQTSSVKAVTTRKLLTDGATSVNLGVNVLGAALNLYKASGAPNTYIKGISGDDGSTVNFGAAISGNDTYLVYTLIK